MNIGKLIAAALAAIPALASQGCTDYGCLKETEFEETSTGVYEGQIDMSYYATCTGVKVKNGDYVKIKINGTGCWYEDNCSGPDRLSGKTWGVDMFFRKSGHEDECYRTYIGAGIEGYLGLYSSEYYEICLVIPDGKSQYGCDGEMYEDNSEKFDAVITVGEK